MDKGQRAVNTQESKFSGSETHDEMLNVTHNNKKYRDQKVVLKNLPDDRQTLNRILTNHCLGEDIRKHCW